MKKFCQALMVVVLLCSFTSQSVAFGSEIATERPPLTSMPASLLPRASAPPSVPEKAPLPSPQPTPAPTAVPSVAPATVPSVAPTVTPAPKPVVAPVAQPVAASNAAKIDFTTYEKPLLVNPWHPLDKQYVPELVSVPNTHFQLEPTTLSAYQELMKAARGAGHSKLSLKSAYRSYQTQSILHERKVHQYKQYGSAARTKAAQIVAKPGTSEHQLGQAIDIANNGSLVQSFGDTEAGQWLAKHAHNYGFILRYPKDTLAVTGVIYEPWHFRYVGVDLATLLYDEQWTLEEYFEQSAAKQA